MNVQIRKLFQAATVVALLASPVAASAAQVFDLGSDFSNTNNPSGPWSYVYGSTLLPNQIPLSNGNHIVPAAALGYFSTGPDLNANTPDVLKAAVNGSAAGETDADFLLGDVIIHSPNPGDPLFIIWTAPSAGSIDFASGVWYAHSIVSRSNDVSITLGATNLGSATISNASFFDRSHQWQIGGTNLAVNAGDALTFAFSKSAGESFGSLDGVNAQVTFTAAVPEPETYAMLLAGLAILGMVTRRRKTRIAAS